MKNLNRIAYIILAVLVGVMLLAATIASFSGDNSLFTGDGKSLASAWFPIALLGIYALVQIGCLALYHFGFNVYKIGFALLHVGMLVMLVGFLAGAIGGERYGQVFYVGVNYNQLLRETPAEDGSDRYSPGYSVMVEDFKIERYEPNENGVSADKYYRADLVFREPSGEIERASLEVNKTYRKEGLKYYLMSYYDGKTTPEGMKIFDLSAIESTLEGSSYADLVQKVEDAYPDSELNWHYFNPMTMRSYHETAADYAPFEYCPAYAYVAVSDGETNVYVSPKMVVLLVKQDPGEYAVIAGMVLVLAGTIMTCLLRRKKRKDEPDGDDRPASKGRSAEREVSGS